MKRSAPDLGCFSLRLAILFLLANAGVAFAGSFSATAPVDADSGVKIKVSSPFERIPPAGYMPLTVTVTNDTDRDRTWRMKSGQYLFGRGGGASSLFIFPVRSKSERSFDVLAPVGTQSRSGGYISPLSVTFDGYGCAPGNVTIAGGSRRSASSGPRTPAFTGVSAEVSRFWGEVKNKMAGRAAPVDFQGVEFDAGAFASDWRAYAGFERIWLTEAEWRVLAPLQRSALNDWVGYGGELVMVTPGAHPQSRPQGFGLVTTFPYDGPASISEAAKLALKPRVIFALQASEAHERQWVEKALGKPAVNAPLLAAFVVALAAVIGPVNLFVFAPARRRQRLFWTTPLISVAASAAAWGVILIQDGVGGWGERDAVMHVLPDEHKAILLQAQAARTGVVWRNAFAVKEPVVMHHISEQQFSNSTSEIAGTFSGDWFRNRSAQGQLIACVRPTRGEIRWLNSGAAEGTAPVLLSSFDVEFPRIDFRDLSGKWWTAGPMSPGKRVTCRPIRTAELPFPQPMCPPLSDLVDEATNRDGYFFRGRRSA